MKKITKYFTGIDQSLQNTGVVVLDSKGKFVESHTWKPKKLRGSDRLEYFYRKVEGLVLAMHLTPTLYAMEGYSYSPYKMADLGELGGVMKLAFQLSATDLVIYPPTVVKKFVCGKGNAKKELVMKEVYKRWGFESSDNNLTDAYGIARLLYEENTKRMGE